MCACLLAPHAHHPFLRMAGAVLWLAASLAVAGPCGAPRMRAVLRHHSSPVLSRMSYLLPEPRVSRLRRATYLARRARFSGSARVSGTPYPTAHTQGLLPSGPRRGRSSLHSLSRESEHRHGSSGGGMSAILVVGSSGSGKKTLVQGVCPYVVKSISTRCERVPNYVGSSRSL